MNMIPVESSNIKAIGYDKDSQLLRVQFIGGTYEYEAVPAGVYAALMAVESKGTYHAQYIKSKYKYRPIEAQLDESLPVIHEDDVEVLYTPAAVTESIALVIEGQQAMVEVIGNLVKVIAELPKALIAKNDKAIQITSLPAEPEDSRHYNLHEVKPGEFVKVPATVDRVESSLQEQKWPYRNPSGSMSDDHVG